MLLSKLVGERTKTNPADATIPSHILLLRAGYIKLVSNGIWSLAMPAKRICRKIENIIRQEMDGIEGQEVSFPVVMPKELWMESGRYVSIGEEMVRFKDRNNRDMLLGMTHEEAAVHFARDAVNSYQQLPFMIYQFQTKFRDEARSRGGLIRVREFIMKDAYSFHLDTADLENYYQRVYDAYTRIFQRIGMKRVVAVKSDTGMMGGSVAHEYMLLTPVGEDSIVLCDKCGYKANMEVAVSVREELNSSEDTQELKSVFTGEHTDIAAVAKYLNVSESKLIKAVCYFEKGTEKIVLCFIRGDLEVNESKLKKVIGKEIVPASITDSNALVAGNIGIIGLDITNITVVYDNSLKNASGMVTGANKAEYHIIGVNVARDALIKSYSDIAKVRAGERCPICGAELAIENGIEVGNIFQLGTKYTKAMGMTVLNKEGKATNPIMGCYGIGIGRALASVAEESNDEKGLIWPMSIAPWQVYLCALRLDDLAVKEKAFAIYEALQKQGIEVLFDDRDVSAGVKFSDCDLMGIPLRVVISPRGLSNGQAELQLRDKTLQENTDINTLVERIKNIVLEKS